MGKDPESALKDNCFGELGNPKGDITDIVISSGMTRLQAPTDQRQLTPFENYTDSHNSISGLIHFFQKTFEKLRIGVLNTIAFSVIGFVLGLLFFGLYEYFFA